MSAMGQKQTFRNVRPMSALPPKADIRQHDWDVRFVPKADITLKTASARDGALAGLVSLIPLMGLNRVFNLSLDGG
jgi:hypothetical protein